MTYVQLAKYSVYAFHEAFTYMLVNKHIHTHIHTDVCMSVCVCLYTKK